MKFLNKSTVLMAALVIAAVAPLTARAEDGGPVHNEYFTITLPPGFGAFAAQAQTAKAPDGKDTQIMNWVSKAPTGEAVVVTVSKMSGKILEPEKLFASTRDSLLKSLKATLDSEAKGSGPLPSSELQFHTDAVFFRSNLAVNNDKLYQLLYVGRSADQRSAPTVAQLFNSFTIAPESATPAASPAATTTAPAATQQAAGH